MLMWLFDHWLALDLALFGFITFRTILAALTALVVSLAVGPVFIRYLTAKKLGQPIREVGPRTHFDKAGTPTMGGALILISVVVATLLWADLANRYVWTVVFVTAAFGLIGLVDDYRKLRYDNSVGLRAWTKYSLQSVAALVAATFLYATADVPGATALLLPFFKDVLVPLGPLYIVLAYFVIVGSSNAVNLTDGLDGLAGGCTIFAGSAFVALSYLAGHAIMADYLGIPFISGSGELGVVLGALVGAMMGFLWFNCYPAQVFMGDTGALAIGALLALAALVTRQEVLLVVVGGVFVVETISVIAQVGWFQMTGHRLIQCSPLHNHFLFKGQHEMKIVVRFWIGSALLAIMAVASLKVR